MKLLLGTHNSNKVREFRAILEPIGYPLELIENCQEPEETEETFEGNAVLKARYYSRQLRGTDNLIIAEDSGLIVQALGNLPGPWSGRFAECEIDMTRFKIASHRPLNLPQTKIFELNCQRILALMRGLLSPEDRRASFKSVIAIADATGNILNLSIGESSGKIAHEIRGNNGFGYDPIFIGDDTDGRTYAELTAEEKNERSHRGKALKEFVAWLAFHKSTTQV